MSNLVTNCPTEITSRLPQATTIIFKTLFGVLAVTALSTLRWKMVLDPPLMHYVAWLIDKQGQVPYRDIYDFNMPGAYLFHLLIGHLCGYGNLGFHIFDLLWSGSMLALVFVLMRPFGKKCALLAVLIIGFHYFRSGLNMTLQRDWFLLLPIELGVWITVDHKFKPVVRALAVGFLFGLAATVKPNAALALGPVFFFELSAQPFGEKGKFMTLAGRIIKVSLGYALGLAFSISLVLSWVWVKGGWDAFVDMVLHYLPLYRQVDFHDWFSTGRGMIWSWVWLVILTGSPALKLCGLWGFAVYYFSPALEKSHAEKRRALLFLALAITFVLYTALMQKFWDYHWMPAMLFFSMSAALVLPVLNQVKVSGWRRLADILPVLAFVFGAAFLCLFSVFRTPFNQVMVEELTQYLSTQTQSDDLVQPLDCAGGAVQSLLQSHRAMATPFLYDFYFYHHVSNPYIKHLRVTFLNHLRQARPKVIIQVLQRSWPTGPDAGRAFRGLKQFLAQNYEPVMEKPDFIIYQRKDADKNNKDLIASAIIE